MSARSRYYMSNSVYALTFRARSGLPFVCYLLIALLIKSALARSQRDNKVILCHQKWLANHAHLLAVFQDAEKAKRFYMEVKKKITDYVKRLMGISHLLLWEEEDSVPVVLDLDAVKNQIVYLYTNAARANLVESIVEYPGVSSWDAFMKAGNSPESEVTEEVHWIRQPAITPIGKRRLTKAQDRAYAKRLIEQCPRTYDLTLKPNAWMKCFGIEDESQVEEINRDILRQIAECERVLKRERNSPVLGVKGLREEAFMKPWTPKKKERKIFVICSDKKLRIEFIKLRKAIFARCTELYRLLCQGLRVEWPPGVFPAPPPVLCNALVT